MLDNINKKTACHIDEMPFGNRLIKFTSDIAKTCSLT